MGADAAPRGMQEVDERIAPVTVSDSTVPVDLPEQTPESIRKGLPIGDADGYNLVLDIGDGSTSTTRTCRPARSGSLPAAGVARRLAPGVTESTLEDQMIFNQNIITFTAG